MALTRQQKKDIVEQLKEKAGQQKIMVFVDFKDLKADDLFGLRTKLKEQDSQFYVAKKTLIKLALEDYDGFPSPEIDNLEGQLAIVFGFGDEIAPARMVYQFAKEHNGIPKIVGGFFENKFRSADDITALAQLPSKRDLLAQLVATIKAPISSLVYVLDGNLKSLVYVLSQIKKVN